MKALKLVLPEALTIECDNQQTIRLLVDEAMKLQTKLRHVDIHSHLLRQEVHRRTIHTLWVPTKEMIADGLTKALTTAKHEAFVKMTSLEDQGERLASIKEEEDRKDALQHRGAEFSEADVRQRVDGTISTQCHGRRPVLASYFPGPCDRAAIR